MLCSIFTPIHTTLNCHYLAILLMVRFCNAVRCWSASHGEHGVKDQVASEHFAHNITGHRGAQLHKYTLILTVLLSSVLVWNYLELSNQSLIWILENIKNDANQITQRRYADFWNPPKHNIECVVFSGMSVLSVLAFGNNSLFMEPEPDERILKNAEERSPKINLHLKQPKNLF